MIVMDYTKEIRPGYKKRVKAGVKTPINRRPGWVPGGSVVCWRMVWAVLLAAGGCLTFWGPEMQGWRAAAGGGAAVGGCQVSGGDGLPVVAFWVACLAASGCLPGMAGRR